MLRSTEYAILKPGAPLRYVSHWPIPRCFTHVLLQVDVNVDNVTQILHVDAFTVFLRTNVEFPLYNVAL